MVTCPQGKISYFCYHTDQTYSDQEGDKASMSGGEASRRDSTASGTSANMDLRVGGGLQPPPGFSSNHPGFGGPSSSTSDMLPTTPNLGNASFQQGGSPAPGGSGPTMSPQMGDYGSSSGPGGYTLHASISSSPEPQAFSNVKYVTPRTVPLYIATQNLSHSATVQTSLDNPPELIHNTDYSSWPSDSTYSTPSSDGTRTQRIWGHNRSQGSFDWQTNANLLPAFSNGAHREIHGSNGNLETVAAPHYVTTHFPMSPQLAPAPYPAYETLLDTALMTGYHDDQTQQSLLDPAMTTHHAVHHRSSSVRSPTPPTLSAQAADTLVTPATLSTRIDPMAQVSRHKEMMIGGGTVSTGVAMLGDDGSSPRWASNSPSGIMTGSALAGVGGCGIGGMAVVSPLPRSVRNAFPSYLKVYWQRFHPLHPFVHRRSGEGEGKEFLTCAMAAMGTQFLNSKEDRIRGNQLHEYAWQGAKRVSIPNHVLRCSSRDRLKD